MPQEIILEKNYVGRRSRGVSHHKDLLPPARKVSITQAEDNHQLPTNSAPPKFKRVRSLSMDEIELRPQGHLYKSTSAVFPGTLSKSKSSAAGVRAGGFQVALPQVITAAARKNHKDMVAARVAQNRKLSLSKIEQKRNKSKDKTEKLKKMKSMVFDPKAATTPEQTKLAKQVARQLKQDDLRKAKEAKLAAKCRDRRRSISLGEADFGNGGMRYIQAVTAEVTAKERREAYGNRVQRESNTKDNLYHVGREILSIDRATVRAERSCIMFLDKLNDELFFYTSPHTTFRFSKKKGIAGWVYKSGLVANIDNAYSDPRFNQEVDKESGFATRNILCCPIVFGGNVLAILQFVNKRGGEKFDAEDVKVVTETAAKLGQIIADALAML
ncbi:hypothetical protein TrCOL_g1323 [Triparma columacea]|uniref:GAF domain-containing protein n=1 Tax=Triparma columacea TaxID=722753 RepID=A0A9W7GI45_9STRA|nr:hypothetical protein TrCOL_g1323 [Triparma columacea]